MKNQRSFVKPLLVIAAILALIYFGPSIVQKIIVLMDKPGIQKVTGFTWPKGTKDLECSFASMQGTWVKVHLQLPPSFQCDTTNFIRFDPAYTNAYDSATMDEDHWNRQRRIYRDKIGIFLFSDMKKTPVASTNLLFSASNPWADKIPWAIVYDETIRQMWIFCY